MSKSTEMKKYNNMVSENLSEENQKIYTDFVCYLRVSDLKEDEQEEIINDVLLMFLECQKEGKSITEMVGGDMHKFTDETIAAINPQKTVIQRAKECLGFIIKCFCFILTIDFVSLYLYKVIKGNFNLSYDFDLSMILRTVIIIGLGFYFRNYIGKNSFNLTAKGKHSKLADFIFGAGIASLIIAMIFMTKVLSSVVLLSINILYVIIIITVYWLYELVNKLRTEKII